MNLRLIIVSILIFFSCSEADDTPDPITNTETTNTNLLQQIATDLNGYKIAFGDTEKIYMMNPDGSNVEELADGGPISGYVSWSPNAKYIYFASAKGATESAWEAFRVNILTKELTKISNFNLDVRSLGVSPDGQTLAISVMTGNSNIGNNNDNLTQFSTNLYTVPMSIVESKIIEGNQIVIGDLTSIQNSPNEEQFWYEELNWNHDVSNPVLAYTKTWKYDEDDVSYTHTYTIKPDGTDNTLISENKDQPIWSIDNSKLSFLDLSYYNFSDATIKQILVSGINNEVSGGAIAPINGSYMVFEIGDENRKGGIAKTTQNNNVGIQLPTSVNIYEPRWSPIPIN